MHVKHFINLYRVGLFLVMAIAVGFAELGEADSASLDAA